MNQGRKNLLGWACIVALLVGFGLFTQLLLDKLPEQEKKLQTPVQEKTKWTKGPGGDFVVLDDGQRLTGELLTVQRENLKDGLKTVVVLRPYGKDGKGRDHKPITLDPARLRHVHQSTGPRLVGKRCVFTLTANRGNKTMEGFLLEKTDRHYRIRLVRFGTEITLKAADVAHVHEFGAPSHGKPPR